MGDAMNTQTTEQVESTVTENATETETQADNQKNAAEPLTTEAIERIVQSRVDKATAELGKNIATLKRENEKLKKEQLSAEELKQYEMNEKEKALAEREQILKDRENRLYAIKAIKEIGLDDGSEKSLSLVDFVMADDETAITERVKAFNELVQAFVTSQVDEKFKSIGRTPNSAPTNVSEKKESNVAETLGKRRAEQNKKSNEILNLYLGGRK